MHRPWSCGSAVVAAALVVGLSSVALGQSGPILWQMEPYCNVLALDIGYPGTSVTLDGFDDLCGASRVLPVVGELMKNPDGTLQVGLTMVEKGVPYHVWALVDPSSNTGDWVDSQGATGKLTPGGGQPGPPRPVPTSIIRPGSLGVADIDVNEIQARVNGACGVGTAMTAIGANGSVTCQPVPGGDITEVTAGPGLTGGGTTGAVALAVAFSGTGVNATAARSDHSHGRGPKLDNTAVGHGALPKTSGSALTAIGFDALASNSTGAANTAVGNGALRANTNGSDNTALGAGALASATSSENTAVGRSALAMSTGSFNTGVGSRALESNTGGGFNTALGRTALRANTSGNDNTAVGTAALAANLTGAGNSALGMEALSANGAGSTNTAVGRWALRLNGSGNNNVAVGGSALDLNNGDANTALGRSALIANTTGGNNIAVGAYAGNGLVSGSHNIYIQANAGAVGESTTLRLGSQITRAFIGGIRSVTTGMNDAVAVMIDSSGQLGTVSSSRRMKDAIAPLDTAVSTALQRLRPVQFTYTQPFADGRRPTQYGLIAEEVADVLPELTATGATGEIDTVKYHVLPTLLLAEVQRLERERAELTATVAAQATAIAELRAAVAALTSRGK